jgi:hypothetical protein
MLQCVSSHDPSLWDINHRGKIDILELRERERGGEGEREEREEGEKKREREEGREAPAIKEE